MPAAPKVPEASSPVDVSPDGLIALAKSLERERAGVMKRIDDVRTMLRRYDRLGALSDEQGEWLDVFFPVKEKDARRSKEDIEATRKAREAARKDGN